MSYRDVIKADLRLALLQLLEEDPGYSHNENVLRAAVAELRAHEISGDMLRTALNWLAEQDLVTIEEVGDMWIARLTKNGEEVALGHARVPGVARPRP